MNILFIKHLIVGFMVSEIPKVSVFGYIPLYMEHYINNCFLLLHKSSNFLCILYNIYIYIKLYVYII